MRHATVSSITDDGIECLIGYNYQHHKDMPSFDPPLLCNWMEVEITSAEVVIAGGGIDILPSLNEKQRGALLSIIYDAHEDQPREREYENGLRISDHI
jgi:hypothetical protein